MQDDDYAFDQADPLFEANPATVRALLSKVHAKELAIPDFQRDFVWEVEKTRQLLASVMSRYPAGTLLFLKTGEEEFFRPRQVDGAPELGDAKPAELVLDGQQRITALYHALYGKNREFRFFLDFSKLRSDDGSVPSPEQIKFDEVIVPEARREDGSTELDTRESQLASWTYPIDRYYQENHLDTWLDDAVAQHAVGEAQAVLKNELRSIRNRYVSRLALYAFPVVRLDNDTSLAAVCTIFETINRQGVPLSVFELLTARFWPKDVNLRDLWQGAKDQYDILEEFAIDPYAILQAVSLRKLSSAQRSDVLKLTADAIEEYWEGVTRGFAGTLGLLKTECGVLTVKLLPYAMVVVPLAAVWHQVEAKRGPARGKALEKLQRYFWCSVFTGNLDQGANSQAGTDYGALSKWLDDDDAPTPEAISAFFVSAQQLAVATVKRRALFAGLQSLAVTHDAKDFHTSQKLTTEQVRSQKIDAHHVFPKKWLTDNYGASLIDGRGETVLFSSELILNRALIDKETNQRIKARPPSEYLADIRDVRGEGALNEILDSHLLPNEAGCGLFEDDYDRFVLSRLELVVDQIEAVTGRQVSRDTEFQSAASAADVALDS